jgi:hypothetical protein
MTHDREMADAHLRVLCYQGAMADSQSGAGVHSHVNRVQHKLQVQIRIIKMPMLIQSDSLDYT